MQRLANRLNRSRRLGRLITGLSVRLADYRGVPILLGVILTVISLIIHLVAAVTNISVIALLGTIVLHLAIFSGLIGILLAEPLGKG